MLRMTAAVAAVLLLAPVGNLYAQAAGRGDFVVTLLGTGTPAPSIERLGPATLVQVNGQHLLFDGGRGTSVRLTEAGVPIGNVTAVFLTHFHSDHVGGLADVWLTGDLRRAVAEVHVQPAGGVAHLFSDTHR